MKSFKDPMNIGFALLASPQAYERAVKGWGRLDKLVLIISQCIALDISSAGWIIINRMASSPSSEV